MSRISEDTSTQMLPANLFRGVRDKVHVRRLQKQLERVEDLIFENLNFASPIADTTAKYLAAAGGKRVRPLLTLLTSELGDGPSELIRNAAASIELTHLASLYHDDVMDEATLRRGVHAVHKTWSNSVAILAGDLLFARASSLISGMGEEAILLQTATFERLCLGQLHETIGPQAGDEPLQHYMQVLADKTGALIASAAQMGVLLSGAPREYADPVTIYGEKIGVAFQLVDDVLDLSDDKQQTGKTAGTDIRAGVATLPMLLLREHAINDSAAADLLRRIDEGVQMIEGGADPSILDVEVQELYAHEVTQETQATAKRWADDAVYSISSLPDTIVKDSLTALAESIVNREG